MIVHKPHHVLFIFFFCNRTCTEYQYSSRFYIFCCFVQDRSLEDHKFFFLLCCRTIFDFRFFADHTISGTRHIRKDNICFAFRFHIKYGCILYLCLYIDGIQSLNVFFNQVYLILTDVAGVYRSKTFHFISYMEAFSSRCCTHIDNIVTFLRIGNLGNQHRTDVLYNHFPLNKCIQCKNMIIS